MVDDATPANLASILTGLLSAEAQARFAALQAAQPLDMTDLGWSPELWIARFDDEDRNADLAAELWVENGLEVPGDCLPSLLALLGKASVPACGAFALTIRVCRALRWTRSLGRCQRARRGGSIARGISGLGTAFDCLSLWHSSTCCNFLLPMCPDLHLSVAGARARV